MHVVPRAEKRSMEGATVNVRFACQATNCFCQVVLQAKVIVREASRLYEYHEMGAACDRCGHKLFGRHRPIGEVGTGDEDADTE